jgi:hypothetical protein
MTSLCHDSHTQEFAVFPFAQHDALPVQPSLNALHEQGAGKQTWADLMPK